MRRVHLKVLPSRFNPLRPASVRPCAIPVKLREPLPPPFRLPLPDDATIASTDTAFLAVHLLVAFWVSLVNDLLIKSFVTYRYSKEEIYDRQRLQELHRGLGVDIQFTFTTRGKQSLILHTNREAR